MPIDLKSYWSEFVLVSCNHGLYSFGRVQWQLSGLVADGSNFWVCGWNPKVWPLKWKLLSSTFLWCLLLCRTRWLEHLSLWMKSKRNHSNESYWAKLSCGAVYCSVQGGSNFWVCGCNSEVWPFKWKLLSSTFLWCYVFCYILQDLFLIFLQFWTYAPLGVRGS